MTSLAIVDTRLAALDTPYALKDTLKAIGGARWNAELKAWTYPVTPGNAAALAAILPKADRTPGVQDLLSDHRARETASLQLTTDDVGPVPWAKLPPWRHQARAYHFARERKAAILALDMGTGKSAVVTWLVAELAQADVPTGDPRVLITCPLSVVGVWAKQFELHSSIPVRVVPLTGTVAAKRKQAESECSRSWGMPLVLVVNHESLWRAPLGPWAKGRGWDMLVVDECHRGKAPGGKLSLYLSSLRPLCRYRLGLTGTLMPHSPLDVYAQARAIDPDVFGTSFTRFRARYAVMGGYGQHQVLGFQNQDDLAAKLAGLAYQVRAGDVLDLPDVQHITRPVELSPAERRVYRDLEREMVAQVESGEITVANALVKLLRLQQATSGYAVTDDDATHRLGTSKRDVLADVLEDLPQRESVVVFCRFRHDLDSVREVAERQGRRYGEVSGRTKDGLAPDATMRPDLDVLGVQIQSGGVGVDLTRSCYAIYFSTGFSLGEVDQSRARVHRPGQTRTTFYYHLVANGTVDEDVISAINEKRDVVESVLAAMRRGQPRQARG